MVANMPKDEPAGQPEMNPEDLPPLPAWVGVVKGAVVIMSVLIVVGLGLLVYGLATGMNRKATEQGPVVLQYPAAATVSAMAAGPDGGLMLLFRHQDGRQEIITLNSDRSKIIGRIELKPGADDFGLLSR